MSSLGPATPLSFPSVISYISQFIVDLGIRLPENSAEMLSVYTSIQSEVQSKRQTLNPPDNLSSQDVSSGEEVQEIAMKDFSKRTSKKRRAKYSRTPLDVKLLRRSARCTPSLYRRSEAVVEEED